MKDSFPAAIAAVLGQEGGYVDHPQDPGGPTNLGITRATLARARGQPVSAQEVASLSREEAEAIYRRFYWDAVRGDDLPAGVDLAVFDAAVHSGPGRAAKLLQEALGVRRDGIIGPATLAAARSADGPALIRRMEELRLGFLARLPRAAVFGRGWRRRVAAISRAALALAAPAPPGRPDPVPSPSSQEKMMTDVKSILSSRTVWSNIVGLAALGLSMGGFDATGVDAGKLVDAGLQAVAGISFIASTLFRVLATRRLV